jgi:NADH-quinone oxidoreductase subunit J
VIAFVALAPAAAAAPAASAASVVSAASAEMGGGEAVLFWVLAPLMVLGALGLLFAKKAVHAALCMAAVMISLGIIYFAQQAPFLGSVQIFVYTGAVMMLFLFVLMLVGVDSADSLVETIKGQRGAATLLGLGSAALLIGMLTHVAFPAPTGLTEVNAQGNITTLATLIFGRYIWAFEVTGALLITAALGAMVLAHRERLFPKPTQRELAERRIKDGPVKAPLPAPGVFARHNAVDIPALLPDGTPSELSVSRVLTARGQMRPASELSGEVGTTVTEIEDPLGEDPGAVGEQGESPTGVGAHGGAATPGLGDGPERASGAVRTRGGERR